MENVKKNLERAKYAAGAASMLVTGAGSMQDAVKNKTAYQADLYANHRKAELSKRKVDSMRQNPTTSSK